MEAKVFEKAFVKTWQGWDILDTDCFAFYDVELQPDLATYVGTDYAMAAVVNLGNLEVTITKKDESEVKLNLTVGWSK